ncbi:MAG: CarD family transcriptional regulator [Selenomonadales bacterium]|nr:CarD family transcriptional regulator [Selenomonadales bacterium]
MLSIGDRVVYPMHGAGIIESIEEQEVMGQKQSYYVLKIPFGNMRVLIPLNKVEDVGLREIIDAGEIGIVEKVLGDAPELSEGGSWNRRFNANMAKLKSGDIIAVTEVVRNLALQDRVKKISSGERRLLDTAKHILTSELALASKRELPEMEKWLQDLLERNKAVS